MAVVIKLSGLPCHLVIKFGNNGQYFDFEQNRAAPRTLESDTQTAFIILPHLDLPPVVAETLQESVEPYRDVRASAFHVFYFVFRHNHALKQRDLPLQLGSESGRIACAGAVDKRVFHLRTRIIVYHSAAHREFIQIVVGKMGYYLSHTFLILFRTLLKIQI